MMKTFGNASAAVACAALMFLLLLPHPSPAAPPSACCGSGLAVAAAGGQAAPAAQASKPSAGDACPCDCGAGKCPGECCAKECACGHKHDAGGKPPMMEGMKKHLDDVRKSVTALKDHEKTLEGITEPSEFRKAAIDHFRMLDNLMESHAKHMESMMGGKGHHEHHGGCPDCPKK